LPEGDSVFRAARALNQALAGRTVTRFESVFPALTRIDHDQPLRGRTIEHVIPRGKHLLIGFSGGLVLRTHLRMKGSWHLYRPGERWMRPHHDMRIVIGTDEFDAVAFSVPIAEFTMAGEAAARGPLKDIGPDPLAHDFDAAEAARRIASRTEMEIADALLDQTAMAGIGNIFKSEVLFVTRVNPFARVGQVPREDIERLIATAQKLMRANVGEGATGIRTYGGLRGTTGRLDPGARLWVYGRAGRPCRRCGTPIAKRTQGPHARSTYWCPKCQSGASGAPL
jgi:endonuclease-8